MKVMKIDPLITERDLDCARAEVGILDDSVREVRAIRELKSFAGGMAMRTGRATTTTVEKVAAIQDDARKWFDFTIKNDDRALIDVTNAVAAQIIEHNDASQRRYLNACQAWLRNPITTHKFGHNNEKYARWKGFDWVLVRTGRMFNTVKARIIKS